MTKEYFSDLNYSLGNEDTELEVQMIRQLKPENIVSVAGCGSRALPLLEAGASHLHCVDISKPQLYITELRKESILKLNHNDFLLFWGFLPHAHDENQAKRKEIFESMDLSENAREYFVYLFEKYSWNSVLYTGKWEGTFNTFSKVLNVLFGDKKKELFEFEDLDKQREYFKTKFPMRRWKTLLFILGNKSIFNLLLYKGHFIKKNVPETYFEYYEKAFSDLINNNLARESFFLNLCFFGEVAYKSANTIEAKKENFDLVKESLKAGSEVHYIDQDLISYCESLPKASIDYISLSDVPSYFQGETEKNFMSRISSCLKPGATVVLRSYLRVPEVDLSLYEETTDQFKSLFPFEKVGMYKTQTFKLKS